MKVGYVAVPTDSRDPLFCGSGLYTHAIIVSVDPFVMVSEEGDMLWRKRNPSTITPLCLAHKSATKAAFERWASEK